MRQQTWTFIKAITILTITAVPGAHADDKDCSPIRLDQPAADGSPSSMQFVSVRNQKPYGVCYAESAVQMVDAYRFSVGQNPNHQAQSSVLSAVIEYDLGPANLNGGNPFNGGRTCQVVDSVRAHGGRDAYQVAKCTLKTMTPAFLSAVSTVADSHANQFIAKKAALKALNLTPVEYRAEYNQMVTALRATDAEQMRTSLKAEGLPEAQIPPAAVLGFVFTYDDKPQMQAWAIASYSCYSQGSVITATEIPACVEIRAPASPDSFFIDQLNHRLELPNAQPTTISYCDQVLTQGSAYSGVNRDPGFTGRQCVDAAHPDSLFRHASLVIGRRINPQTNRCQFLVRNSWGSQCMTGTPRRPVYAPEWDCDHGNIWVDTDALAKNTYELQYLAP